MDQRFPEPLRFVWAALFHDGGEEYGIWGAMAGGVLWVTIAVIAGVILIHEL